MHYNVRENTLLCFPLILSVSKDKKQTPQNFIRQGTFMKKLLLITFSFITLHVYAMKMEIKEIKPLFSVGWLASLPVDFTTMVAQLLFYEIEETEEEFIERTKALKIITIFPPEYLAHYEINKVNQAHHIGFISACCPNNRIFTAYKSEQFNRIDSKLFIIDTIKNEKLHEKEFSVDSYYKIAISGDGNICAYIHHEEDDSPSMCDVMRYKTMVSIQNMLSKKIKHHEIRSSFNISYPHGFDHPTIAFNKQGTKVILHGTDYWQLEHLNLSANQVAENPIRHHMIIPLTKETSETTDNQKTLARYFAKQMVCKDLNKQLALTHKG
jgi:hypothetical protein